MDGDCIHEIKSCLFLGRKAVANLDCILKSRDITLLTKVPIVKAMVFPIVMYRCESRTIKKTERWRIDVSELLCWRGLLRVPWTARISNQSIIQKISPEYSDVEADPPVIWLPNAKSWFIGKDCDPGKTEGKMRKGQQRMR